MSYKHSFKAVCTACLFGLFGISSADVIYNNADLGIKGAEEVATNLAGLEAHSQVFVSYDLYIYDSWDGLNGGTVYDPDFLGMNFQGNEQVWSFDNWGGAESYLGSPDFVGNINDAWLNAVDKEFINYGDGFTFNDDSSAIALTFRGFGIGFQPVSDESWQIKNLRIETNSVPEPATFILIISGLLGLAGMAGRKRS